MRLRKPSLSKHRLLTAFLAGVVLVALAGCESPDPITMPAPDSDAESEAQVSEGLVVGVAVLPPTQRITLPSPDTPASALRLIANPNVINTGAQVSSRDNVPGGNC